MRCPNCNGSDWENVDWARMKTSQKVREPLGLKEVPIGMSLCTCCGFISYPEKYKSPEALKQHYRNSYRKPPTHFNIFTCERKNNYHYAFLNDLFEEWKAKGIDQPKILEIGSAFGFTLQWIRTIFPKAELHGTELTTSYRRNAFHEFKIKLDEDFDDSKKYDLIISYKVIEHQLDPDKELARYAKCLNENGVFYVSVPTWFNSLMNPGKGGFDLDFYYDTNHVNVWTKEMFENMLARAGFEITKNDQVIYFSTYLAKANPDLAKTAVYKEDPIKIKESLKKIKDAFDLYNKGKYAEAVASWPDYPSAHHALIEMNRKDLSEKGWEWFKQTWINKAIELCPTSADVIIMATEFAMRAGEMGEAIEYCKQALSMKPENPNSLFNMIHIMRDLAEAHDKKGDKRGAIHYFVQAREAAAHLRNTSSQFFREATDFIYEFNSRIPFPGEFPPKLVQPKKEVKNAGPELSL